MNKHCVFQIASKNVQHSGIVEIALVKHLLHDLRENVGILRVLSGMALLCSTFLQFNRSYPRQVSRVVSRP